MAELAANRGVVKAGDLFPCSFCGSAIVAGEGTTVTCDVCRKVSAKAFATPWLTEEERKSVNVAVRFGHPMPTPDPYELRPSGALSQPHAVKLEREGRAVTLRFRAGRRGDLGRIVTASAVLAFWAEGVLRGAPGYQGTPWSGALMLGFLCLVIVPPLNRYLAPVVLTAKPGSLEVKSRLFGVRKHRFERSNLRQLYCESRTIPAKDDQPAEERFHLFALLDDQTTVELAELGDADSALYLERELERALDIKDKPVNRTV